MRMVLKFMVRASAVLLAIPFLTYGFLGLIHFLRMEGPIQRYLAVIGGSDNPVTALILVVIGCCLLYGLNALADKVR
jgi:hypothetical protein